MRRAHPWQARPSQTRWLSLLVLSGTLFFSSSTNAASLGVERLDLDIRLDPQLQALYGSAKLTLRNTSRTSIEVLSLRFPAPLGTRAACTAVWDTGGELGWRSDPAEELEPRELNILLRSPLKPGKKFTLGLNFEIDLEGLAVDAPASVSPGAARLAGAGWYPLPGDAGSLRINRLRLVVRLPKNWQVSAPVNLKRISQGALLASYELEVERPALAQTIFSARSRREPQPQ